MLISYFINQVACYSVAVAYDYAKYVFWLLTETRLFGVHVHILGSANYH